MVDGIVRIQQDVTGDRPIDNQVVTNGNGDTAYRQRMVVSNIEASIALDATTLAALETVGLDAATLAALETISLANFPADYPDAAVLAKVEAVRVLLAAGIAVTGPLTDTQLRATPVPVSGTVSSSGTVDVTDRAGRLLGIATLDAVTLAALETINAAQSGTWTVVLDSTSLAALETINAAQSGTWTMALDSTTLAALETVSAAQSGTWTVALDSATLTDLNNITVTVSGTATVAGTVTVDKGAGWTNPQTDALTDTQLRLTPVPVTGTVTASGAVDVTDRAGRLLGVASLDSATLSALETVTVDKGAGWTNPQTDAITETQLRTVVPDLTGTWDYLAGTNGTINVPANGRVLQITAVALGAVGTFTINGGPTITMPYNSTDKTSSDLTIEPKGQLVAPQVIFDANVDSYFIEFVT